MRITACAAFWLQHLVHYQPKSPWQRGTNENTNRLLRQYLARSEDLRGRDQQALDELAGHPSAAGVVAIEWS